HKQPRVLMLKMRHVSLIDVTGITNLETLVKKFVKRGGTVMITELNIDMIEMMKGSGLYDTMGAEYVLDRTKTRINKSLDLISTKKCPICSKHSDGKCQMYRKVEPEE